MILGRGLHDDIFYLSAFALQMICLLSKCLFLVLYPALFKMCFECVLCSPLIYFESVFVASLSLCCTTVS